MPESEIKIIPTENQPNQPLVEEKPEIYKDEELKGLLEEGLNDIKNNEVELDKYINQFGDMINNDGDATSATKEAFVNLVNMKNALVDKKTKIAELIVRVKLKDPWPRYLTAKQTTFNINTNEDNKNNKSNQRDAIQRIDSLLKRNND